MYNRQQDYKRYRFICQIPNPNKEYLLGVLITCNYVLNNLKIDNEIQLIFE